MNPLSKNNGLSRRSMLQLTGLSLLSCMTDGLKKDSPATLQLGGSPEELLKRAIPSSNEKIPIIGLGTWRTFNVDPSGKEIKPLRDVLQTLSDNGAAVVDSSPMYGSSETVIGQLSNELNTRPKLFLATKVWTTGRESGISQMNDSFKRMKTDTMDLLQVHNLIDADTHIKTLRAWKEQGKIRYFGITHYVRSAYPELIHLIKKERPDFVQFNYNISNRDAENELLPLAKDMGVAVIINRPFEEGTLFNTVRAAQLPPWSNDYGIRNWAQFFLKFILSHPAVTCTIPGTSKADHLLENLGAAKGIMPDEQVRQKMIRHFNSI